MDFIHKIIDDIGIIQQDVFLVTMDVRSLYSFIKYNERHSVLGHQLENNLKKKKTPAKVITLM